MRILLLLSLLLGTLTVWAQVPVEKRALLAMVDLAEEASKTKWLYRLEGAAAVRRIKRLTNDRYEEVVVHAKKDATLVNFLASLKTLLENPARERIDIIIYVHGKNPEYETGASVCFVGTPCTNMSELSEKIRELSPENLWKLRMVYSDACWGQYHMDAWLAAGFRVVNGSKGVDANHSADLRRFLKVWGKGATYVEAMEKANSFWLTPVVDGILRNADSIKLLGGETNLTIED